MREFKFRAWDKYNNKMLENVQNEYDSILCSFSQALDGEYYDTMQYTGLNDKNDKEVYEGDIIKYHFGDDMAEIKYGSYQSCFDSQKTEHIGFYVDWKTDRSKNFRKDLGYWIHMVDVCVAGNIYENPELLKD